MDKTVHELELHEEQHFCSGHCGNEYWVMRVPGGWIYTDIKGNMCFVPWSD